jgi:PAS domain S-box-containing protein
MVTKKHKMEIELRERERQFSAILKSIGNAVIATDKEGFVTFMNPLAEMLTGRKKEHALKKNLREIFHLLDEERNIITENYVANILREGNVVNLTNQPMLIAKAGTEIPIDVSASPIKDEKKNITGVVLVFHDISERKQREETLRRKQEEIRSIFASSPDAIMIIDMKLRVMECNQAALDLLGYSSKEEMIGKNFIDFVANEDHQRVIEDAKKALEQSLLKDAEYTCLTKDSKKFIPLISASIVRDASGQPLHFVVIAKDITKIKLSKQKLQVAFDGMKDGIMIVDQNYEILMANSGILRIFNKNNFSDLIGTSCFSELYENKEICEMCPVHEVFKIGEPYDVTKIYHGKGTEKIILDISSLPIKDANGKVTEVIVYKKDVTDKINLEDQLISQERIAAIGELASGIAHEIRNPLGNISASVQYCLSKYKFPKDVKKYLKIVLKNSENANRVIKDLLNFAKPRKISFKMGDIGKVINNSCDLIKAKCLSQGVRLICRLPKRLPQILLDEKRLIEVFSNIILNALDAIPNGGRLTVMAYGDFQNNEVVVSFLDTGKGIPEENLNKIFDPFFTTKTDGIGLGLCLALQVINDHKGKINIESKIDYGTEVIIRLPISRL